MAGDRQIKNEAGLAGHLPRAPRAVSPPNGIRFWVLPTDHEWLRLVGAWGEFLDSSTQESFLDSLLCARCHSMPDSE